VRAAYRLETPVGPESVADTRLLCHFCNSEAIKQTPESMTELQDHGNFIASKYAADISHHYRAPRPSLLSSAALSLVLSGETSPAAIANSTAKTGPFRQADNRN
jgi:hypothetical protein